MIPSRRRYLSLFAGLPLLCVAGPRLAAGAEVDAAGFAPRLQALERRAGGRLGACAMAVGRPAALAWRADERFLMCSTFKLALAACVLQRVDAGQERLDRGLPVPATGLISWSPVTEKHAGGTLPISRLCEAAITVSDNTAANLLLGTLGGPEGLTRFMRSAGDPVTRLDRTEPTLNLPAPGEDWDTTTPRAMAGLAGRLMFGDTLARDSRGRLQAWTAQASTGLQRLRAALPAAWPQGDKTGTGPTHTNDVAWCQPPTGAPWVIAAYYADGQGDGAAQNAVLAEVGRIAAEAVAAAHGGVATTA